MEIGVTVKLSSDYYKCNQKTGKYLAKAQARRGIFTGMGVRYAKVLWSGTRTPQTIHPDFLEAVN